MKTLALAAALIGVAAVGSAARADEPGFRNGHWRHHAMPYHHGPRGMHFHAPGPRYSHYAPRRAWWRSAYHRPAPYYVARPMMRYYAIQPVMYAVPAAYSFAAMPMLAYRSGCGC